jgi:type II secretory pathway pseudopilin PulG
MRKKRYITLMEIMIVILLIGIITSVIGYNVKGSLNKAKIFKTKQAQSQIKDLLLLEVANGASIDDVIKDPKKYLDNSGLPRDVDSLMKDGWGEKFQINTDRKKSDIIVSSKNLEKYEKKHKQKPEEKDEDYY